MKAVKTTSRITTIITVISLILLAPWVYDVLLWLIGFLIPPIRYTPVYQFLHIVYVVPFFAFLDSGEFIFYSYFISVPIAALLTLILFWMRRKKGVFKYLPAYYVVIGLLTYSLFLKNFLSTTGNYFLSINIKEGATYSVIDFPQNMLSSAYKRMHIYAEGRSVNYEILGWQNNTTLVYQQWNRLFGAKKQMTYDLQTKHSTRSEVSTSELKRNTCDAKDCLIDFLDEVPVSLTGCLTAYVSPDGQRFACLAAHLYGPQDIVIFTAQRSVKQ